MKTINEIMEETKDETVKRIIRTHGGWYNFIESLCDLSRDIPYEKLSYDIVEGEFLEEVLNFAKVDFDDIKDSDALFNVINRYIYDYCGDNPNYKTLKEAAVRLNKEGY